ncbi:hypothetical protein PV726_43060 [Streptomyces europaeiscabiei]|uniref:hypothetical protein n=1 Tax=Streptomyces europaeiscabiei TaxID=146819 RepID=UPI0029B2C72C|nr:hypothetical protein [Streptomyces europaeiscabiei]MDX3696912.1 hypothetical protein [Streptomyces europaeiscabiei]
MLNLVYEDPRGWLRHYIKKRSVPNRAMKGTGFVYVLAITGAVSYVKVGSTAGPRARFEALRSEAHRLGSTVSRAWLSPAHPDYQTSEARTLAACRALSPSSTPRSEYFPELAFVTARREAVKAVLGVRDQPRVSVTTLAAGLHEPVPSAVQRRLAPSVYDIHRQRQAYFAQGSRRSRFRQRNASPPEQSGMSPFLKALKELAQPRAAVIDLSSRRQLHTAVRLSQSRT